MAEDTPQTTDHAAEIESLRAQLKAATEKVERFAKQREEARAELGAAKADWRTREVAWRLQQKGVDKDFAEVLARQAPDDDKLEEFEARWTEKFKAPTPVDVPKEEPKPEPKPAQPVIMVPPRPGIVTPTEPADPQARLMSRLAEVTRGKS
jgi:hypothetical protein